MDPGSHTKEQLRELYQRALSRQLAAQVELLRRERPDLLELSVLLALESMRRSPSVEADQVLRQGLALLPRRAAFIPGKAWVSCMAYSPSSARLAWASFRDPGITVCASPNGEPLLTMSHEGNVNAIAFSPDGSMVASASVDHTVRLWRRGWTPAKRRRARLTARHGVATQDVDGTRPKSWGIRRKSGRANSG